LNPFLAGQILVDADSTLENVFFEITPFQLRRRESIPKRPPLSVNAAVVRCNKKPDRSHDTVGLPSAYQEDVMTDHVEERLDEIEQRIVANMGQRTKALYLAFNFGDVIDLVMEEQFPGFGRDVDDHLAEMFETFLSEHE
jgi:hypothetical protein